MLLVVFSGGGGGGGVVVCVCVCVCVVLLFYLCFGSCLLWALFLLLFLLFVKSVLLNSRL